MARGSRIKRLGVCSPPVGYGDQSHTGCQACTGNPFTYRAISLSPTLPLLLFLKTWLALKLGLAGVLKNLGLSGLTSKLLTLTSFFYVNMPHDLSHSVVYIDTMSLMEFPFLGHSTRLIYFPFYMMLKSLDFVFWWILGWYLICPDKTSEAVNTQSLSWHSTVWTPSSVELMGSSELNSWEASLLSSGREGRFFA